jgi:hypothetical protein
LKFKYQKLNNIFYVSLFLAFFLLLLPPESKSAIYGPNYLGWFWIIINIPIVILLFLYLLFIDLNNNSNNNTKKLLKRILYFLVIIVISIIYWFYQAKKYGNI